MKILIIEDEPRAAKELKLMLLQIDDTIQVAGTLESVEQAKEWFATNEQPDVILSDIQLADGLSFEIYSQVNITSAVIFCTAFDEYLMHAFETNAVSYLLKPITIEKLEKALEKYKSMRTAFGNENLQTLIQQIKPQHKSALLVNEKEKIIPVQVKDIACIYLDNTILQITTLQNKKYFITATMDETERILNPAIFYRANRQYLINREAVANAERYFARKLVVKLSVPTEEQIVVSKARASDFLQWLESGH